MEEEFLSAAQLMLQNVSDEQEVLQLALGALCRGCRAEGTGMNLFCVVGVKFPQK